MSEHPRINRHAPRVASFRAAGQWGVYCEACSEEAAEYVYPCKVSRDHWPPPVLVDPDA